MSALFLTVLRMSAVGSVVILLILAARLLMLRLPQRYCYPLWTVAAFRLVCPVSVQSVFSIFNLMLFGCSDGSASAPSAAPAEPVVNEFAAQTIIVTPADTAPVQTAPMPEAMPSPDTALQIQAVDVQASILNVLSVLWIAVGIVLLGYAIRQYVCLWRQVRSACRLSGNVYVCDTVRSPFVIGLLRPRIILPESLGHEQYDYILLHERTHIRRCDHLIKPFAVAVLILHWYNPLVWLAYRMMVRDMEMSCDECVLDSLGSDIKRSYSLSLVSFARERKVYLVSPLSFGQSEVKMRIRNILNHKKHSKWTAIVAVLVCALLIVGCVPDAVTAKQSSDTMPQSINTTVITASEEFPELLGESVSSYNEANSARACNIAVAAGYINGTILQPDEEFSFNDVVGERTPERGFSKATVYAVENDGEVYGGGVMQTASALFSAAFLSGMNITEHTTNEYCLPYTEMDGVQVYGNDASVTWGKNDLCFVNVLDHPVIISMTADEGTVTARFYGTAGEVTVGMDFSERAFMPHGVIYREPTDGKTDEEGVDGRISDVYRCLYVNGEEQSTHRAYTATYQSKPQIIYTDVLPEGLKYGVEYESAMDTVEDFVFSDASSVSSDAPSADALWSDTKLQYLLGGVPVFEDGTLEIAVHLVKGVPTATSSCLIHEGYVPQTDMIIMRFSANSADSIDAYIDALTDAGFTYFAPDADDSTLYITYNAPSYGIGVQIERYGNNAFCMTFFKQRDRCYGDKEPVPKG